MSGPARILEMTKEDVPEALALWKSSDGVGLGCGDSRPEIETFLERNPGLSLVARSEAGRLAGAVLVGSDARRGFLYHLAVECDFRRKGLGSRLVEQALSGLARAGIGRCNIVVFQDNLGARAFWGRNGWRAREDLIVLTRDLSC